MPSNAAKRKDKPLAQHEQLQGGADLLWGEYQLIGSRQTCTDKQGDCGIEVNAAIAHRHLEYGIEMVVS